MSLKERPFIQPTLVTPCFQPPVCLLATFRSQKETESKRVKVRKVFLGCDFLLFFVLGLTF